MRFAVVWMEMALDELAQIWIDADDKRDVTQAGNRIDLELAIDPDAKGEPDQVGVRVLSVPPLEVAFVVLRDDRLVRVTYVKRHS